MADPPAGKRVGPNEVVLRLWPVARSVRQARQAVSTFCRSGGLSPVAADAELLTSELVTNSCRAVTGLITVVLLRDAHGVVVTVSDDDPSEVCAPAAPPDGDALGGRGTYLVDQIASDWGATRHDADGKTVWFRLDLCVPGGSRR